MELVVSPIRRDEQERGGGEARSSSVSLEEMLLGHVQDLEPQQWPRSGSFVGLVRARPRGKSKVKQTIARMGRKVAFSIDVELVRARPRVK